MSAKLNYLLNICVYIYIHMHLYNKNHYHSSYGNITLILWCSTILDRTIEIPPSHKDQQSVEQNLIHHRIISVSFEVPTASEPHICKISPQRIPDASAVSPSKQRNPESFLFLASSLEMAALSMRLGEATTTPFILCEKCVNMH